MLFIIYHNQEKWCYIWFGVCWNYFSIIPKSHAETDRLLSKPEAKFDEWLSRKYWDTWYFTLCYMLHFNFDWYNSALRIKQNTRFRSYSRIRVNILQFRKPLLSINHERKKQLTCLFCPRIQQKIVLGMTSSKTTSYIILPPQMHVSILLNIIYNWKRYLHIFNRFTLVLYTFWVFRNRFGAKHQTISLIRNCFHWSCAGYLWLWLLHESICFDVTSLERYCSSFGWAFFRWAYIDEAKRKLFSQ